MGSETTPTQAAAAGAIAGGTHARATICTLVCAALIRLLLLCDCLPAHRCNAHDRCAIRYADVQRSCTCASCTRCCKRTRRCSHSPAIHTCHCLFLCVSMSAFRHARQTSSRSGPSTQVAIHLLLLFVIRHDSHTTARSLHRAGSKSNRRRSHAALPRAPSTSRSRSRSGASTPKRDSRASGGACVV